MLTDNSGPNGELDTESFQRAMLQYRNTPNQDTKLSLAMCLFGRPIKDFIPILPGKYLPHTTWQNVLQDREWDKTGSVVEVRQHDQCVVRVDGSRRVTLRNRKFLRRNIPVRQTPQFVRNNIPVPTSPTAQRLLNTPKDILPTPTCIPDASLTSPARLNGQTSSSKTSFPAPSSAGSALAFDPKPTTSEQTPALRRSSRIRKPPSYLNDFQT